MTHLCVSKLPTIGSDNGLSPGRRQAIIWTNAGILLFGPLGTNFSEIFIEIYVFSFKKMHLKMLSGNCRPFCLGLNVLTLRGKVITDQHQSASKHNKTGTISIIFGMYCLLIFMSQDGLAQDCSNSSALALELLQSCANPSIWSSKLTREPSRWHHLPGSHFNQEGRKIPPFEHLFHCGIAWFHGCVHPIAGLRLYHQGEAANKLNCHGNLHPEGCLQDFMQLICRLCSYYVGKHRF